MDYTALLVKLHTLLRFLAWLTASFSGGLKRCRLPGHACSVPRFPAAALVSGAGLRGSYRVEHNLAPCFASAVAAGPYFRVVVAVEADFAVA